MSGPACDPRWNPSTTANGWTTSTLGRNVACPHRGDAAVSRYRERSDTQLNADALERRGRTYADPNAASFRVQWDSGKRGPRDLRHAVELCRRAYRDEVPTKLHESGLAPDGTPAMTAKAEAYIFGSPTWTDAGKGDDALVSYFLTPFRARLAEMERHPAESTRRHASIVRHVTIGGQTGEAAAQAEGVPSWCSRLVAFEALRTFLNGLSDVHVVNEVSAA